MRLISYLFAGLSLLGLGSCAGYTVVRLQDAAHAEVPGIRYWRPVPYLLVSAPATKPEKADAPPALTYQLIYLPDPNEAYAIQYHGGLGATEVAIKLENGWQLTDFGSKADSKIPETITAVGSVLAGVAGIAKANATGSGPDLTALGPGLYKLDLASNPPTLTRVQLKQ